MKKFNIDFVGNLKKYLIVSLALIVAGIIAFAVMGVEVDINFKGGSTTIRIDMELSKASNKTFSFSSRSISSSYRKQSIGDFIKSIK